MKINQLSRANAQSAMQEWLANYPAMPSIDSDYIKVRAFLQKTDKYIREENYDVKMSDYEYDVQFACAMYEYFDKQEWFNMRVASNDGFWRYLSLKVAPDIVAKRWEKNNDAHYWSKPNRVWFKTLWWYIFLTYQGDIENTKTILLSRNFSTDTILNLVERTGKHGTFVNVYRNIVFYYSNLDKSDFDLFNKKYSGKSRASQGQLFRTVMKLNTAKSLVIEPALYLGGEPAYAKSLFEDAGVTIK